MSDISTSYKRLFLRDMLWTAQDNDETLQEAMKTAARARLTKTSSGKVLVGSSANGHAMTWQVSEDFTPTMAVELVSELLDRYDQAVAKLVADSDETPTDAEIVEEMLGVMDGVKETVTDFSGLREEESEES